MRIPMPLAAAGFLAVLAAAPAPVVADDDEVERRTYQSEKTIIDPAPGGIVREREYVEPGAATVARERKTSETIEKSDDDDDGDTKIETKIEHDD